MTYASGMTISRRMRARMVRALIISAASLTTAGVVGCGGHSVGTGDGQPRPVRVSVGVDSALACELSGVRSCGHLLACWYEADERVCGYADRAVVGSHDFAYGDWLSPRFAVHSTTT